MRSVAQQSVAELGGQLSVLTRQKRDHVKLDNLLHRLSEVGDTDQERVLLEIWRLVFPHAFAEEAVLWPVIRRLLPDGQELTLRVELEHQRVNELVRKLESLKPGSPERPQVLNQIVALLREDVRDEEDVLLPKLQAKLTGMQQMVLGVSWEVVRRIAPTRTHPIVSRRPPGNILAALPLSLLDRSRDNVDRILHRSGGGATQPLQWLSSALGRVSRAVERLPGMRRGEDPATRVKGYPNPWGAAAIVATVSVSAAIFMGSQRRKASLAKSRAASFARQP